MNRKKIRLASPYHVPRSSHTHCYTFSLHFSYLDFSSLLDTYTSSFTRSHPSGSKFEIYWINPDTEELVLMSDPYVINGASHDLNSFVDHEFQLRELPNKYGVCKGKDQVCRTTYLTVTESTDQCEFVLQ